MASVFRMCYSFQGDSLYIGKTLNSLAPNSYNKNCQKNNATSVTIDAFKSNVNRHIPPVNRGSLGDASPFSEAERERDGFGSSSASFAKKRSDANVLLRRFFLAKFGSSKWRTDNNLFG